MKLLADLYADHGLVGPYRACPRCPGTVRDALGRLTPMTALPGRLGPREMLAAAEALADELNALEGVEYDERSAAA